MTKVNVEIRRDIGRLIAQAVPAKLTFDQACMRAGLFNEIYLHGLINEIVVSSLSVADFWIRSGFAHPALQHSNRQGRGSGRPRELDFFITPTKGRVGRSLAVEVKWTPSAHCNWTSVLADLYRLKLVAMADSLPVRVR